MKLGVRIVIWVAFFSALMVAFGVGHRKGHERGMDSLRLEVAGTLTRNVLVLSNLRTDQPEEAIELLEIAVDRAATTLAARNGGGEVAPSVESVLAQTKLYRSVVPSPTQDERVAEALRGVDAAPVSKCAPALGKLVEGEK